MVRKDKWELLQLKLEEFGIFEKDLTEKFILGSGSGGQNLQKTSSAVYLKHNPTGLEVKCMKDRSQDVNRYLARTQLLELYLEKNLGIKSKKTEAAEKIRKQKKRASRKREAKALKSEIQPKP